jgi:hypothetical protein
MSSRVIRPLLSVSCFLASSSSWAVDVCAAFRNTVPLPDWYNSVCNPKSGKLLAQVGGAFSTFADSFNLNPASIPTSPTPYGIEYVSSFTSGTSTTTRSNFALVKGYQRIGAGISTNSDDTFYSNSQTQNFVGTSYGNTLGAFVPDSLAPTLNFGTAFALLPEQVRPYLSSNLGATIKYNKINGKIGPGGGLSLATEHVSLGLSMVHETDTEYSPATTYYTFTAGYKSPSFQIEYIYLKNVTDSYLVSWPMQIATASLSRSGLTGTAAIRRLIDFEGNPKIQFHFAIQYQFSRYFSAGYLYNYIPGTQSLGAQVFL